MNIYERIHEDWIQEVKKGKTLLYPTDTIWGLGTAAFSQKGVDRIYEIKNRPQKQPLILLVHSIEQLKKYVADIPPRIETLLFYVERPLTLIYPKIKLLPTHLLAEDGTVGIRICQKPYVQELIKLLDQPLVSTSANINDESFPKTYEDISETIKERVDFIYRPNIEEDEENQPSVVARFDDKGELHFLRT